MRKLLCIIIASISLLVCRAEQTVSQSCEELRRENKYPDHYCDCWDQAIPFRLYMDTVLSGTTWFKGSIADLQRGLTAYWFADNGTSVSFEVYAWCSSPFPSKTQQIPANRMKEMDVAEINELIKKMGQAGDVLTGAVDPHILVTVKGDGSGRVLCYPYNEGPHSTCEDALKLINRMIYVRNETEDVYVLPKETSRSRIGLRWKQEKDSACTLYFTKDSCNGQIVAGPVTLTDSMHIWLPDSAAMAQARNQYPLYLHATSSANLAGRLTFFTAMKADSTLSTDTTLCEGKCLQLGARQFCSDTTIVDTTFLSGDSLVYTHYQVHFNAPKPQSKTISITQKQIDNGYLWMGEHLVRGFGKDTVIIEKENECTQIFYLTVNHKTNTQNEKIDSTLCEGKSIVVNGKVIERDTVIQTTTNIDYDTQLVTTYTIRFTPAEVELDTIQTDTATLEQGIYYPATNNYYFEFGTYTDTVRAEGACTRIIALTILTNSEPEEMGISMTDSPPVGNCYKILRDGQIIIVRDEKRYTIMGTKKQETGNKK